MRSRQRQVSGDGALIRALYQEHGRAVLAYTTRLTGDRGAAEDIVQETLIRAWRHPEVLADGSRPVRAWLFTVARNLITDRARSRAARPAEVAETPTSVPVARDHAGEVVDSMVVMKAMDTLSRPQRDVLQELYFHGRTMNETASVLGIPPGTVRSRSFHALRAMRAALATPEGVAG